LKIARQKRRSLVLSTVGRSRIPSTVCKFTSVTKSQTLSILSDRISSLAAGVGQRAHLPDSDQIM
jgi:hypothetical protein